MYIVLSAEELDSMFVAEAKKEAYALAADRLEDEGLTEVMIFQLCDTGTPSGVKWEAAKPSEEQKKVPRWSAADKRNLLKDHAAGISYAALAKKYGRSEAAISNKIWYLRQGAKK